jgi:hypothetical protein
MVLACGSASASELHAELPGVHIFGDALAPRRWLSAGGQAHAFAEQLVIATTP